MSFQTLFNINGFTVFFNNLKTNFLQIGTQTNSLLITNDAETSLELTTTQIYNSVIGGGNISGMLTINSIPVALTSTSIGNSHIQDRFGSIIITSTAPNQFKITNGVNINFIVDDNGNVGTLNNIIDDGSGNCSISGIVTLNNGPTTLCFIKLNSSNQIIYDTNTYTTLLYANSTFQSIADMINYLTISDASLTYLTITNASSTYQQISGMSAYLTTSAASSTYQPISGMSAYLTISNAASTYQPISGMSSYLTTSAASLTYLTITNASSTYQPISGMSAYLTISNAASTYQPISGMSSYLTTSSAASTYQTITGMSSYLTTASAASTYLSLTGGSLTGPLTISEYSTSSVTTLILDNTGSGNNVFQMEAGPTTAIITLNGSSPYNFNFGGSGALTNYVFSLPLSCTSTFSATSTITTGLTASSLVQTNASKQLIASNTLPSGCSAANITLTNPSYTGTMTTPLTASSIIQTNSSSQLIASNTLSPITITNNTSGYGLITSFSNTSGGLQWDFITQGPSIWYQYLNASGVFLSQFQQFGIVPTNDNTNAFFVETASAGTHIFQVDTLPAAIITRANTTLYGTSASQIMQTNSSNQVTSSNTLPSGCSATNMTLTTPTISGNLTTNSIIPTASATYNIGTSSNVYSTIYSTNHCSTFYYDSSLTYYLNYVSGVGWESNTNLSPQTNGSFSLGTSSYKWGNIYANAGNYYGNVNITSSGSGVVPLLTLTSTTTSGTYPAIVFNSDNSTIGCNIYYGDSNTLCLNPKNAGNLATIVSQDSTTTTTLGTSTFPYNAILKTVSISGALSLAGNLTQTGATSISTGTNGITCNGALTSSGQITSSNNTMIASNWSDGVNTRGFSILWQGYSSSYAISFKSGTYGPAAYIFDNPINGTSLSLTNTLSTTGNISQTGSTGITSGSGGIVCNGVMSNYSTQTMKASSGWTNSYITKGSTYTNVGSGSSTVVIASWAINTTNGVTYRIKASINGSGSFQNGYDFVCPESTYFGRYYSGLITLSAPTITYYNSNPYITWGTSGSNVVLNMVQNSGQGTYVFVYWEIQLIYPSLS